MPELAKQQTFTWTHTLEVKSPLVESFFNEIKEAYWAENHLVRTLLKMLNAASSWELRHLLNLHLEQTKSHATKLEHIFELLDQTIDARKSDAISGLSLEANEMIDYTDEGTATRDIGIILVSQKIEQYEIAAYNGLIKVAASIGRHDIAGLFTEILHDETECMERLAHQCEIITHKAVVES